MDSLNDGYDIEVGYRIFLKDRQEWFGRIHSYGGACGMHKTEQWAKNLAKSKGIRKGTYELWKFHIGLPTSKVPWFPPEKVYE
jgi:hypothetical protein